MLIAAAVVVSSEVILRKIFTVMYTGSDEIASYLFAVGTSWSLAYVLVSKGHVRIDVLYSHFHPRLRALCDILALAVMGLFVAVLAERGWTMAWTSVVNESRSNTPLQALLAVPQLAWLAGIGFFLFAIGLSILRSVVAFVRGDLARVNEVAGAASQGEEIEKEFVGLGLKPGARLDR